MDAKYPPYPPDPGAGIEDSQVTSRKRQDGDSPSNNNEITKKSNINPATTTPSIQKFICPPSLSESCKFSFDTDKGPLIVYVSKETPHPGAGTSIKFGHFLHINKISNITSDGVQNVGRKKICVELSIATAANFFCLIPFSVYVSVMLLLYQF